MKVTTQIHGASRVILIDTPNYEGSITCTLTEDPVAALRSLAKGARLSAEQALIRAARWEEAALLLEAP